MIVIEKYGTRVACQAFEARGSHAVSNWFEDSQAQRFVEWLRPARLLSEFAHVLYIWRTFLARYYYKRACPSGFTGLSDFLWCSLRSSFPALPSEMHSFRTSVENCDFTLSYTCSLLQNCCFMRTDCYRAGIHRRSILHKIMKSDLSRGASFTLL